jgi:OFA family oxalate/formate antiporter-like MFS transporter
MAHHDPLVQPPISRFWPFRRAYYGWAILTAGVLSSFATVPTQGPIVGLFVQQMRDDLGWSATAISVGFVAGSLFSGIFTWAIGGMLDRHGARGISVVAGIIIGLCMFGLSVMEQPWHFWAFFGLARGVAGSGAQVGVMVSLAAWWVRKRGRIVGLAGMGQRLGQTFLPIPIFAVMAALGWREAWVALGILVILLVVVPSGLYMRRRPEDYGLLPDGETAGVDDAEGRAARSDEVEETWTLAEAKRTPTLWLLIFAQALVVLSLNATNLHIAASFQDKGLSFGMAVAATTIFAAVSALSTLPWGLAMERVHTRYVGLAGTGTLCVAMVLAIAAQSFPMVVLFSVTYGLALGAWTVTSRMLFANYFGRRSFGSIRGFAAPMMMAANPAGPILAGYLRDSTDSYTLAFSIFAGMFVVSFGALLLAVPPKKRVAPLHPPS